MPTPIRDAPSCDVSDLANKIVIETFNEVYNVGDCAVPVYIIAVASFSNILFALRI